MQHLTAFNEEIIRDRTLERRNEELLKLLEAWKTKIQNKKPKLIKSLNMHEVENLIIRYYQVYKVPISLYDEDGNLLFSIGWKNVNLSFHKNKKLEIAGETIKPVNNRMADAVCFSFKIRNYINALAIPINVKGDNLGTLVINQFFYDDELPDIQKIQETAYENGISIEDYVKACDDLPKLSCSAVEKMAETYILFSEMISFIASHNIQLQEHQNITREKNEIYSIFKEKLDEQSNIIKSLYQILAQKSQEIEMLNDELSTFRKKPKIEKSLVEESQPG